MPNAVGNEMLTDLGRRLVSGSLSDESLMRATEDTPNLALVPWANVVKIGGQSIMDRGRAGLMPVVDEIVRNLPHHKMILGTGAGTRARHIYSLAIDLGLPVGVLTVLGTAVAWQNAQMLQYLLASHGIAFLEPEGFASVPHYLMERGAVICQGMPPYKLWEQNPDAGRIPPQRTDTGCFLIAEVFGARKMIYVKDEDGLYSADPKKHPNAEFIPRISVQDLLKLDLNDLVVERAVLEMMLNARHITEIQFVNGLKPGQLTAALNGEPVGTIIYNGAPPMSGAHHVVSKLMRESLMDRSVIAGTEAPVRAILPALNVIQIGGQSIMDRGHTAVLPVLDEILANQAAYTQVIGVGPGVRARHILSVGLDLGLPTGALATLAAKSAAQNAYMVSCLLASHGFVYLEAPFIVQLLPAMLAAARGAVFNGVPPYDLWEHPPALGKIPPHGSDAGSYLVGEVFGARSVILIKDVDGVFTADPKSDPGARLIPDIRAGELIAMRLKTLPIEPVVLELLTRAKLVKSVRIINGLVPGNLTRALAGEDVGTVIRS